MTRKAKATGKVIDLMEALKASLAAAKDEALCGCDRRADHRGDDDVMRCAKCHYMRAYAEGEP